MDAKEFVQNAVKLADTITEYKSGMRGQNGQCDCIGLVIGALEMGGVKWDGTHGTNYAVRNEMRWCSPLEDSAMLREGMVVYKSRGPSDNGYALPDKYKKGSDLNDYHHVGIVTGVEPLRITHCTSPGPIVVDKSAKAWKWYGELEKVAPIGEEDDGMADAWENKYVRGGTLNLRKGPGTRYDRVCGIPDGASVLARMYNDTWSEARYTDDKMVTHEGYVLSEYLTDAAPEAEQKGTVTLELPVETAKALLKALERPPLMGSTSVQPAPSLLVIHSPRSG